METHKRLEVIEILKNPADYSLDTVANALNAVRMMNNAAKMSTLKAGEAHLVH